MSYRTAFENRVQVVVTGIEADETGGSVPSEIEFTPYHNPDVSVDVSSQFATHQIIGGTTVRQKIGKKPSNITVKGVCDESTAQQIDRLSNAKQATFVSDRITRVVQIGSANTTPYERGGAADMDGNGELLYNYTLSLIVIGKGSTGATGPGGGAEPGTPQEA